MLNITPSKNTFVENAKAGRLLPVYAELPFISPQNIYESMNKPLSFLLESIKGPENISRYSFIGSDPFLTCKVKNSSIEIHHKTTEFASSKSPLRILKELLSKYKTCSDKNLPPLYRGSNRHDKL